MKSLLLTLAVALSSHAYADTGAALFKVTGTAECHTSCLTAAQEATESALKEAQKECGPLTALRASPWNTRVVNHGILKTEALFACVEN